ncbi:RNA-binding KH domain-containing protein RCF3-like [Amaranthus tricolor]|uniref:RNA-binding KH domain-containing protein RCF3-like n=1 Tax=Amaranthus tricolor TaxID=29722 RepID=UPI00258E2D00|nr:RNA-binding KH domain-containing protein RCF3-like [Amaranthus tricolor]
MRVGPGLYPTVVTILCQDAKIGRVMGKSGSIINTITQHTGAWIEIYNLIPGDKERINEVSDTIRRDPDGRMPKFSAAQNALIWIHHRILEIEGYMDGGGNNNYKRVVTKLVVSKLHVGSLMG